MKVIDVSKWNSGDSLGMDASSDKISRDFWDDEESHCISLLFMEQEDRDQVEELAYIEGMTKNKLFEIFIKMCPNGVSKSRKHRRIAAGLTRVLARRGRPLLCLIWTEPIQPRQPVVTGTLQGATGHNQLG